MEVIASPWDSNKFEVLFNGSAKSCYHDTDCPGAGICAINQEWARYPGGWCMCNTKFGLHGVNCNEWCDHGYAVILINVLGSFIGLVLFLVSAYLLFGILRQREQRKVTPIVLTLAFVVIGSFCLTIAHIFGTLVGPGFSLLYEVNFEEDGGPREIKRTRQELEHANSIFAALAFCLSTSSIVVLPLTWIDIAQSSFKLKRSQTSAVIAFSILSVVVILLVILPFYVLLTSKFRIEAPRWALAIVIGWAFIYSSIALLNALAFVRITQMKRSLAISPFGNNNAESSAIRRMLTRIQMAAGQLVIVSLFALATSTLLQLRLSRGLYTVPHCYLDSVDAASRLSRIGAEYGCAVAVWFLAPSALRIARTPPGLAITGQQSGELTRYASQLQMNSIGYHPHSAPYSRSDFGQTGWKSSQNDDGRTAEPHLNLC